MALFNLIVRNLHKRIASQSWMVLHKSQQLNIQMLLPDFRTILLLFKQVERTNIV